jgi:hypothetical protein
VFEFLVEHLPTLALLLLHFDFILIAVAVFPLPVTGLVELNVGGLAEELDVLYRSLYKLHPVILVITYVSLSFSYHDRSSEMTVKDDEQFIVARLEEKVFDVTEEDIWMAVSA